MKNSNRINKHGNNKEGNRTKRNSSRLNKKAYFFLIDSLLAMVILGAGTFMLLSTRTIESPTHQAEIYANDAMNHLSMHTVRDIRDEVIGYDGKYVRDGIITNPDMPLIHQIMEFYFQTQSNISGSEEYMNEFISRSLRKVTTQKYNMQFQIYEYANERFVPFILYKKGDSLERKGAKVIIPQRRFISSYDAETQTLRGPYILEVLVWY